MNIDSNLFSESFFYIGPGFDIQPLVRFSNLCQTFLYTSLYLGRTEVESWYDETLGGHDDIDVISKDVFLGYDARSVLERQVGKYTDVMSAFKMGPMEFMNYFMTFKDAKRLDSFLIVWKLRRKSLGRSLTLCFFTWEGLEAYANLSQNGSYAPRVLCTIETGVLESPLGVMNRFFLDEHRARPLIWVRGFEPTFDLFFRPERRDSLDPVGVFSVSAMAFNHQWSCGYSYPGQKTEKRHCAGFMTGEMAKLLSEADWNPKFPTKNHPISFDEIQNVIPSMGNRDIVIMSGRLIDRHKCEGVRFYAWENILGEYAGYVSVKSQLSMLKNFLMLQDLEQDLVLHIVPWHLEDEDELYFEVISNIGFKIMTYFSNKADMIGFKDINFCSSETRHKDDQCAEKETKNQNDSYNRGFLSVLEKVNVSSKDDGLRFYDTSRLDEIDDLLISNNSSWVLFSKGDLFRLYHCRKSVINPNPVLVSSHADSNYQTHFFKESGGIKPELIGTFDNSITNATLLKLMLDDKLHSNLLVVFTGDEERESRGATEVISCLRQQGVVPRGVLVLDITDNRYYGNAFTIENYFAKGGFFPKTESGFLKFLLKPFIGYVPTIHHDMAYPDESWIYEEENVHVVSLCMPTMPGNISDLNRNPDWMHLEDGVRVRQDLIEQYAGAIVLLTNHMMSYSRIPND